MKNVFFLLVVFLALGCKSDKEKIIGVWEINAIIGSDNLNITQGTIEFDEDGIALIKDDKNVSKMNWCVEGDSITFEKLKLHFSLKKNRLKMKSKDDKIYFDLIKK